MGCVELALSSSGLYATTRIGAIHSVVQRHRTRKPQAALGAHAAAADARLCEYSHVGTNGATRQAAPPVPWSSKDL